MTFSSRLASCSLKTCFVLYVTLTFVLDLAMSFAREHLCSAEWQGTTFHLSFLGKGSWLRGSHSCAPAPEEVFPALPVPSLHTVSPAGILNAAGLNLKGQEAQPKQHVVCPTLCLALCSLGETSSLWLVMCGGLMPFYETSEEKPESYCSFL